MSTARGPAGKHPGRVRTGSALAIELDDPGASGDEFGMLPVLVLHLILSVHLLITTKNTKAHAG